MIVDVKKQNDIAVISLKGSLDVSLQRKLKEKLLDLSEQEDYDLVLDFEKVSFIDSSCLGTLVSLAKTLREKKGDIKLSRLSNDIRAIFQITRLDRVFDIFDTPEEAVAGFFK